MAVISEIIPPQPPERKKPKRIEPLGKTALSAPLHEQAKTADPSFKTPDEIATEEEANGSPSPFLPMVVDHGTDVLRNALQGPKILKNALAGPKSLKKHRWWPGSRRWQIVCCLAIALVVLGGAGAAWMFTHHAKPVIAVHKKVAKKVVPPKIIYSTLTGLPVADESVNQRPVTGVMIENSLDARPQSGLGDAGVVFEAVAEGGVTRFLALFQDTAPDNIGPIRSARPYYIQWALGFDAAYAHVGGSPDALADIANWGVHDMNQFYNGAYYHRTTDRPAPHNVYTSVATLNQLEASKGYTSTYTGFPRGKEAPIGAAKPSTKPGQAPATPAPTPVASIDFNLSGPIYDPHYAYNATTNSYDRNEDGEPHTDANTGKQISPKVVIAMVVPLGRGVLDASGAYYSDYATVGSGQVFIFQNGTVTTGTWTKTDNNAQLTFTDANGAAIPLVPGQTWISAVDAAGKVSYK
ncbi:MAG TPA: DUF3048 domain-containing protein [Candidatus Saccharimonadales bacterium]|nr:DUF3048 domain-containing protein [Candidatus Saccharimonadales bacterium]